MGFTFIAFGAATVPVSKVIVDGTLDMGDYPLVGQKIMAPYRPYTWETEPFPYNDTTSTIVMDGISKTLYGEELVAAWTCDTPNPCYVRAIMPTKSSTSTNSVKSARIAVNSETVYTTGSWTKGTTKTTDAIAVSPGDIFELYATGPTTNPAVIEDGSLVETGYEAPINLHLEGRFLALKQDFGTLTATLTFGDDVDVPFSEYINRFPYAPDKITLSIHTLEDRPVINVYKGV